MLSRLTTRGRKHRAAVSGWVDARGAGVVGFHGETRRIRAAPRTEPHPISRGISPLADKRTWHPRVSSLIEFRLPLKPSLAWRMA